MRDIKRIGRILGKIIQIWSRHPDWRLGQLLVNVTGNTGDMYYIEDSALELNLDNFIGLNL